MELLFATTNQGKFQEARQILSSLKLSLLSLADFEILQDVVVEETGESFEENSFLKAQAYGDQAQVLTLAEDSGLLVTSLNNRPGIYSARFGQNTAERNRKLLTLMRDKIDRRAKFVSTLCLYNPATQQADYFVGEVAGSITTQARGEVGFGYDPVFTPDGYKQTFAELGMEVKNKLSHRARALEELKTEKAGIWK